jgi:ABC-type polysaccharide/polyol phosphate export permease
VTLHGRIELNVTAFKEAASSGELIWNLALRELRGRYKRSALGWFWSLLNPLFTMVIYTIVFSRILRATPPPGVPSGLDVFGLYLLCGLLPWNFFSISVTTSMATLVGNGSLIKKVYFPREALVLGIIVSGLITFGIELALLCVVLLLFGNFVIPWLPVLALLVALLAVFTTGVCLLMSSLNVFFRDLSHLWALISQAWFFLTPIVYPLEIVPTGLRSIIEANPMTVFVVAFRDVLYNLRFPAWDQFALLAVGSFATLAFGWWVFLRLSPRFAEEL